VIEVDQVVGRGLPSPILRLSRISTGRAHVGRLMQYVFAAS
jgi:hypothetical protein